MTYRTAETARTIFGAALIVGLCGAAFGQSAPALRTFEVASVRPHPGPVPRIDISTSGPRFNAEAYTALKLITYAFNLNPYQVSLVPVVSNDGTMYDVVAKSEGARAPSKDEFRQMVQSLLADRFKLRVHREMKEMPVYVLVVGKNGPKLKESAPDADPTRHFTGNGNSWQLVMPKGTADDLIQGIMNTGFLDRPVLDKTGLSGTYNISLTYTPENRVDRGAGGDSSDISIFTAVQEQLGLRLEPQKARLKYS